MTWATPSLEAPGAVTLQELREHLGLPDHQLGAAPRRRVQGRSNACSRPRSSGTGAAFVAEVLGGVAPAGCGHAPDPATFGPLDLGCPTVVTAQENNEARTPALTGMRYQQVIMPYSAAIWSFASQNANSTRRSTSATASASAGSR